MSRDVSLTSKLIQAGVLDLAKIQSALARHDLTALQLDQILQLASAAANPDQVVISLLANPNWLELNRDELTKLGLIIGLSDTMNDWLQRRPELVAALSAELAIGAPELIANFHEAVFGAGGDLRRELVRHYQLELISIAAADLTGQLDFEQVSQYLSWLADAVINTALAIALSENSELAEQVDLAVIALGKTGGNELNYISDVDVIFIGQPKAEVAEDVAMRAAAKIAANLIKTCSEPTADGSIWQVDAALRPEGKAGPLVRTISSYLSYYDRWAETWEFQALLKARHAAGSVELAKNFIDGIQDYIWQAATKPNFVENARRMRVRVEENIDSKEQGKQLKLGRGGLRDIEFAVQLLQLVHGRTDEMLRTGNTMAAISALANGGYIGRKDADLMRTNYSWLRTLEHRLQLRKVQRTHVLPDQEDEWRILARSMQLFTDSANSLQSQWEQIANQVRDIHQKLFYRPLLDAVAVLPSEAIRLSETEAENRLRALGYLDAKSALRHIEALTNGSKRRAAIQRTLLPVLLNWWATAPSPDRSLLAFRRLSEALGESPWFLSSLRDDAQVAERVAKVTSASEFLVDLLLRAPETLAMLADDAELAPRSKVQLKTEANSIVQRHSGDPIRAIGSLRSMRRRELVRIGFSSILELAQIDEIGLAITELNKIVLQSTLEVVINQIESETNSKLPIRFAIIAMGRFGGAELGFGSDLDVIFVHKPLPGVDETAATPIATKIASEVRSLLMAPHPDPAIELDADLRPEGKKGPLVRTLDSYRTYYERWSISWESQALLRAAYAAGDEELANEFLEVINPLRWPKGGMPDVQIREVRLLKARMEAERLPKGADPAMHLKLGKGGLSDVEWAAQLLQLCHAATNPALQSTRTIQTLAGAAEAGLITPSDAAVLTDAWQLASKIRNGLILSIGKNSDSIPADLQDLRALAFLLGYPTEAASELVDRYLKTARRAREVFERLFYDS